MQSSNHVVDSSARELRRRAVWILALGLAATATPLLILASVELNYVRALERTAARAAAERAEMIGMLERVRRSQTTVRQVALRTHVAGQSFDEQEVARLINDYRDEILEAGKAARGSALQAPWDDFQAASNAFTSRALGLLSQSDGAPEETDALFQLQDNSMVALQRLVDASHAEIQNEVAVIVRQFGRLRTLTFWGVLVCVAAGAGAAIVTIRTVTGVLGHVAAQKAELRQVTGLLVEQQETAARRFSHELHDELGQTLAALKANVVALEAAEALEPRQAEALALADDAIRSVRDLSHLLHPTILENLGLAGALESLVESFGQRTGIEAVFRSGLAPRRLPEEARTHLYRIAQEALTNVAQHSSATRVAVTLSEIEGSAFLEIQDNGRGVSDATSSGGIGLKGMEARAAFAGGQLRLASPTGGGLSIQVRVPLGRG